MFIFFNPNPRQKLVGDCVIRAISKITDMSWDDTFESITNVAFLEKDMPSANNVWGEYLKHLGFNRFVIPDTCPACYRVKDFCLDHPYGRYVLATGSHVVAVINGNYYDSWDSGEEIPIYYWKEKEHVHME